MKDTHDTTVFVSGARGFVGSALLPWLSAKNYEVVAGSRRPAEAEKVAPDYTWQEFDVFDPETIREALRGCEKAFYLVHSMGGGPGYAERERKAARNFAEAAEDAGVRRIVYLGGVAPQNAEPSPHLESRLETGNILRSGAVPATELRASMVIGPGSESWKIVRDLAARLPIMILPKWCQSQTEPIFIDDVVVALELAAREDSTESHCLDLPGPDVLTIEEIFAETADVMGSRPGRLRVPLLTPTLSSYWLKFVSGANYYTSRQLVEGLRHDLLSRGDKDFWNRFPDRKRTSFRDSVRLTLSRGPDDVTLPAQLYERLVHRINAD